MSAKPLTPAREAAFRHDVDQPDCWALGVTRPEARALLASLDEARAQRDRNLAQAEEAMARAESAEALLRECAGDLGCFQHDDDEPAEDCHQCGLMQRLERYAARKPASEDPRKSRPCGNPDCSVSTGVDGALTHGSGRLDDYGYWEHPCAVCAREGELRAPSVGERWPFEGSMKP
jgi:hypothetical protein